mmetsp:Transcript_47902/g.150251  ORF Transcript_47902/g.150251 Transcript_47902/m.150251 type:complete len:204 (-) Transcript_47902:919-1530(-)
MGDKLVALRTALAILSLLKIDLLANILLGGTTHRSVGLSRPLGMSRVLSLERLSDLREHGLEPSLIHIERLSTSDPVELAGPELEVGRLFIMADHSALSEHGTLNSLECTVLDQREILVVGCCRAGEVSALLNHGLLGSELLGKLVRKVLSWVHSIELRVAERVSRNLLSSLLHLLDDVIDTSSFGDEDVDIAESVHHLLETL